MPRSCEITERLNVWNSAIHDHFNMKTRHIGLSCSYEKKFLLSRDVCDLLPKRQEFFLHALSLEMSNEFSTTMLSATDHGVKKINRFKAHIHQKQAVIWFHQMDKLKARIGQNNKCIVPQKCDKFVNVPNSFTAWMWYTVIPFIFFRYIITWGNIS